jgi:low temperature requirement protein LtrA
MLNNRWFYQSQTEGEQVDHGDRKISWLELFYDLVYVATVIQLGNLLSDNVSVTGFVLFIALFIPLWRSWTAITFYVNRFLIDDIRHRALIFTQMIAVSVMAISIGGVFGDLYQQFVFAYVVIRVILVILYLRAGHNVPRASALTHTYALGFGIAAILWLISAFLPQPINYVFWALGLIVETVVPFSPRLVKTHTELPPDVHHMTERYGIFTIIVLGESFVKVIDGIAGIVFELDLLITSVAALSTVCMLWWLYFGDIGGSHIANVGRAAYIWIYGHFPIAVGITGFGVAVKKTLDHVDEPMHDEYRLLACVTLIIFLVFVGIINRYTTRDDTTRPNASRAIWRFGSAIAVAIVALLSGITPLVFSLLIFAIFAITVASNYVHRPD